MDPDKDIIILPCTAGHIDMQNFDGRIQFRAVRNEAGTTVRPFDMEDGLSWYEIIEGAQMEDRMDLIEAYKFYQPRGDYGLYLDVFNRFNDRFLIFSSGWGLIKATYRIPSYDITFNRQNPNTFRAPNAACYHDINHLPEIKEKFTDAKIYSVLSQTYRDRLPEVFKNNVELFNQIIHLDPAIMGNPQETRVYRYVRKYILNQ